MKEKTKKAYAGTDVPVERSRTRIRDLIMRHGGLGYQVSEDFNESKVIFRFVMPFELEQGLLNLMVRIEIAAGENAQEERQNHRAIYYFLKSQFEATEFGIVKREDVFLPFVELPSQRLTVGEYVRQGLADAVGGSVKGLLPGAPGERGKDETD